MIALFRKLGWLAQRRGKEEQLAAELQFHLDEETEERRAAGMSAQEASRAARRELGNPGLVQEETRARWSWTLLEQLAQDLRYGARTLLRNPAFTALASLSLALGIGANTAIYSLMDALLMRSLPVTEPASLAVLQWHITAKKDTDDTVVHNASGYFSDDPKLGKISPIFPFPAFEALRKSGGALSVVFAYRPAGKLNAVVGQQAEIAGGEYVSGDYFQGLGVVPAAGRLIADGDDRAGAPPVVALSYGFATARFGDAASAIGRSMPIDNIPFTVIGVVQPQFFGVDPSKAPDLYLPFHADLLLEPQRSPGTIDRYQDEHYYWTEMMGRLRPGVTLAQAQARLAAVFDAWVAPTATTALERKNLPRFLLQEGAGGVDKQRRSYSRILGLLLAMVGLILAVACTNIASLLLARSAARRREMAVRLSIGAGRWRVIRQLLTESLLLALLGGGAGILAAVWGIRFLSNLLSTGSDPFTTQPGLNAGVLAAALLLTLVTGLLFGLAPALQAARVDPMPALKESRSGGPQSGSRFRFGFGRMLVVFQLAMSLLLLVGADLFLRTLANLHSLDAGFDRQKVLLFKVNARQAGHRDPEILSFYNGLETHLAAIAGVRAAAMANSPLIGAGAWGWPVVPLGQPRPEKAPSGHGSGFSRSATHILGVSPGFFSTMRIPLLAGREFNERDRTGTPPVAIVNEAWAKVNIDGANPVGQLAIDFGLRVNRGEPSQVKIVGLSKNTRYDDLMGQFPAIVYFPVEQNAGLPMDEMTFFLRTAGDPLGYAGAVRETVRQADSRIPVAGLNTQSAQIENEMVVERLFARLCTAFALLSLAIALVGLYATTSYTVARRTNEIGIRMALGAQREAVIRMVLRDVLTMAIGGLAIGLPAALGASKLIESLLFGVKPGDPWAMAAALAILLSAALAAGYLPARKASWTDPMEALRQQ
jgi:macrolide transport system ATP-binding/permease protein